jgi:hypothetical protein
MALLAYEGRSSPPPFGLGQEPAWWSYHEKTFAAYGARGLELGGQNMDSLLALARRHRISLTVVIYPWPDQVIRRHLESSQVRFWQGWAERNEVPLVNLFPLFIGEAHPESVLTRYFMPFDQHWTAAGHRLIADSLLEDSKVRQLLGIGVSGFPQDSAKEARAQPGVQRLRADEGGRSDED